jgi:hypothetical protein
VDGGGGRHPGRDPGQGRQEPGLAALVGQPQQDRVAGSAAGGEPVVAGQLAGQPGQVFGAGVVLEEVPDPGWAGPPDAVPVRADEGLPGGGVGGGGVLLGPPPLQPGAGVGTGVGEQVDVELVDPEQVAQAGAAGDAGAAFEVGAGWAGARVVGVGPGVRVQQHAERAEGVPERAGLVLGAGEGEPGHRADTPQHGQPFLRRPQAGEQRGGDLLGGQHVVLGQPGQQQPVPGRQPPQVQQRVGASRR